MYGSSKDMPEFIQHKNASKFASILEQIGLIYFAVFSVILAVLYWQDYGSSTGRLYLFMGAVLGVAGLSRYSNETELTAINYGKERKTFNALCNVWGAFFPWAFGCYLTFYKGIWGLIQLFNNFSITDFLLSAAFLWIGVKITQSIFLLTEYSKGMHDKTITIVPTIEENEEAKL